MSWNRVYRSKEQFEEDNLHLMMKRMQEWEEGDVYEKEADDVAEKVAANVPVNVNQLSTFAQPKAMPKTENEASSPVEKMISPQLENSKGTGEILQPDIRAEMESKMNTDFTRVNIHTGAEADGMSKTINAKAFAHGNDIYFRQGNYNPSNTEGKKLLAHELTHTQQQKGGVGMKIQRQNGEDLLSNVKAKSGFNSEKGELNKIVESFQENPGAKVTGNKKNIFEKKYGDQRMVNLKDTNYKKALKEELKKTIDFALKRLKQRTGNPLPAPALESIADLAVAKDLKWIGNYIGVTNKDMDFRTGGANPNLFAFGNNKEAITGKLNNEEQKAEWKIRGEGVINAYALVKLAWLHRKFNVEIPKVAGAVKYVSGTLQEEDYYLLQRTFRGETVNVGDEYTAKDIILLDTLPFSNLQIFEMMLDQAELAPEKLQELRAIAADQMIKRTDNAFFYEGVVRYIDDMIAELEVSDRQYGSNKDKLDTATFNAPGTDTERYEKLKLLLLDEKPKGALKSPLETEFEKWEGNAFENDKANSVPSVPRREISLRYQVFQTMLHEFLHYVTNPNYQNEIEALSQNEPAKRSILLEGVIDLFAFKIWEQFRAGIEADPAARGVIEGWWNDPKTVPPPERIPAFHPELIPKFPVYEEIYGAFSIEKKAGIENMKAAFFLGHTELLGFGKTSESLKEQPVKEKHIVVPGDPKEEFSETMYEVAFQRGLYQTVEGNERLVAIDLLNTEKEKMVTGIETKIKDLETQLQKEENEKKPNKKKIARLKNEITATRFQAQKAQMQQDILLKRSENMLTGILKEKEALEAQALFDLNGARKKVKMDELETEVTDANNQITGGDGEGGYARLKVAEEKLGQAKTVIAPEQKLFDEAVKNKLEITNRIKTLNAPTGTVDELREKARQELKDAETDLKNKTNSLSNDISNAKNKTEKQKIYDAHTAAERKVQILKEVSPTASIQDFTANSVEMNYNQAGKYNFPFEGTADQNWKNYAHYTATTSTDLSLSDGKTYVLRNDDTIISLNDATLDALYKDNKDTRDAGTLTWRKWFTKFQTSGTLPLTVNVNFESTSAVRKAADTKIPVKPR